VLAKLQKRLPNQIGTNRQWTTTYISSLTLAAAHAAEERIGMTWVSSAISLTNGANEYAVPTTFIEVVSVEFSLDGTTYTRHLDACTLDDLDGLSMTWRDDTGSEPTRYALLSTPGTQGVASPQGARIIIHRKLATAGSAKIRLNGWGIGTAATTVPDDVQERVLVPYIMAILRAEHDVREAKWHYDKFISACDEIKGRFIAPYAEQPHRLGGLS
jgi:hypothetical protein